MSKLDEILRAIEISAEEKQLIKEDLKALFTEIVESSRNKHAIREKVEAL